MFAFDRFLSAMTFDDDQRLLLRCDDDDDGNDDATGWILSFLVLAFLPLLLVVLPTLLLSLVLLDPTTSCFEWRRGAFRLTGIIDRGKEETTGRAGTDEMGREFTQKRERQNIQHTQTGQVVWIPIILAVHAEGPSM
jgi:hypothetical protein